jgi:8-oxo-dGTP diphosphatase
MHPAHLHPVRQPHRVACALLIRENRVFLAHRSPAKAWFPDVWDLPGGHLEAGESSAQALVRELREELGVDIAAPEGHPLVTHRSADLVLSVWLVEAWRGDIANAAPEEHDAIGWFTLAEAVALPLPHDEYRVLFQRMLE